jgi:hypothetical protein
MTTQNDFPNPLNKEYKTKDAATRSQIANISGLASLVMRARNQRELVDLISQQDQDGDPKTEVFTPVSLKGHGLNSSEWTDLELLKTSIFFALKRRSNLKSVVFEVGSYSVIPVTKNISSSPAPNRSLLAETIAGDMIQDDTCLGFTLEIDTAGKYTYRLLKSADNKKRSELWTEYRSVFKEEREKFLKEVEQSKSLTWHEAVHKIKLQEESYDWNPQFILVTL